MSTEITSSHKPLEPKATILLSNDLAVEIVPLGSLKEPGRIIRPPTPRAVTTAQNILQQFGQRLPLLVDEEGTVIVGLELLRAARQLGWTSLKVVRLENVSDTDKRALSLALHRLPELSDWDDAALALELEDLLSLDLDFDLGDVAGFSVGEMDVILEAPAAKETPDALEQVPEPPLAPTTEVGDVWLLGPHRVICGSTLDPANITLLMAGESATMVLTDPPYNIAIKNNVSRSHDDFQMGVGEQSRAEFVAFLKTPLLHLKPHLRDGTLAYVFMDRRHLLELQAAAEGAGLCLFDLAIWNKGSGGMGSFYRSQHEPCMIFKHGSAPHRNNVELGRHGRYRTNVWDHRGLSSFGKGRKEALAAHPTVKPVALLAEAIKDCTCKGDILVDPFLGSGSTLLAAEKTGRIAYGVELEPKYVDVVMARWQAMTGKKAILEDTGESFAEVQCRRLGTAPEAPDPAIMTVQ